MATLWRFALALVVAAGLSTLPAYAAQYGEGHKTKAKAKGEHSMTGCLQKGDMENTYRLTNVEGTGPKTVEIEEVASGVDLAAHVGHEVTITGTALSTKKAMKAEGTSGTSNKKKEAREHHMKVDDVRMVSETCR